MNLSRVHLRVLDSPPNFTLSDTTKSTVVKIRHCLRFWPGRALADVVVLYAISSLLSSFQLDLKSGKSLLLILTILSIFLTLLSKELVSRKWGLHWCPMHLFKKHLVKQYSFAALNRAAKAEATLSFRWGVAFCEIEFFVSSKAWKRERSPEYKSPFLIFLRSLVVRCEG